MDIAIDVGGNIGQFCGVVISRPSECYQNFQIYKYIETL